MNVHRLPSWGTGISTDLGAIIPLLKGLLAVNRQVCKSRLRKYRLGDISCIPLGSATLVVLRKEGQYYAFVGEAYLNSVAICIGGSMK